jgi:hypothetical protein
MRQPRGLVSEAGLRFGHQAGGQARARGDQRHGQVMLSHVAVGRLVEHAAGMPGAPQVEEVQRLSEDRVPNQGNPSLPVCVQPSVSLASLAFRWHTPSASKRRVSQADRNAGQKPFLPGMPRTGLVNRHVGRCLQSGPQDRLRFADEILLFVCQQALHLAFRDRHAERAQECLQAGQRGLPLVVLHQHEAAEFRAEMARWSALRGPTPSGNGARMVRPSAVTSVRADNRWRWAKSPGPAPERVRDP